MDSKQSDRLGRCTERLFSELNAGRQDMPFRTTTDSTRRDVVFAIVERAPAGSRHPEGGKWKQWPGITWKQAQIIEATSQSDEEIIRRMRQLIFHGNDTTKAHEKQNITSEQIDEMVHRRVEEILRQKIDQIMKDQSKITELAKVTPPPVLQGIQSKYRKKNSNVKDAAIRDAQNQVWEDRAKIMGIGPVLYNKTHHRPDGRWMRFAVLKWEAHTTGKSVAEVAEIAATPTP